MGVLPALQLHVCMGGKRSELPKDRAVPRAQCAADPNHFAPPMTDAFEVAEYEARRKAEAAQREHSVAAEAERLVHGKRAEQYGEPAENMVRIGRVWGALLDREPIAARTVALMMAALKLARETGPEPKRDNLVDACGYLLIADLCGEG